MSAAVIDIPAGLVHPRYGIAREILRFPTPLSLPNFFQVALPLASHRRLRGAVDDDLSNLHGSAFETNYTRALQVAVGEAIERYSGALFSDGDLLEGSANDFEDSNLTSEIIVFTNETYASPDCPFDRYDPTSSRWWARGEHVLTGDRHILPAQVVIFDFPCRAGERLTTGTTNGLASGRLWEAACLAGLSEVVERDAFTCHWLLGQAPTPIEVDPSGMEPLIRELLSSRLLKVSVGLLKTDIGVPVVLACIQGQQTGGLSIGASCRLDIRAAIRKAILEAGHSWAYTAERKARGVPTPEADAVKDFLDHAAYYANQRNVHHAEFLLSEGVQAITQAQATQLFPSPPRADRDLSDHLAQMAGMIADAGYAPLVFDRTAPDVASLGYCVVRAVIPGLQPLWAGKRWIPDDSRRLKRILQIFGLDVCPEINHELHPFP